MSIEQNRPGILDEYTPSDIHNSMNALLNGIGGLSDDITTIREGIAGLKETIAIIDLRSGRNERELFDSSGRSRIVLLEGHFEKHALQIKGLWATVMFMAGFLSHNVLPHVAEASQQYIVTPPVAAASQSPTVHGAGR